MRAPRAYTESEKTTVSRRDAETQREEKKGIGGL